MYLLIRYAAGIIVEGVVLAMGSNRLRVVVAGFPDTLELTRDGAQWSTSSHEAVEIDFLMSDKPQIETLPSSTAVCNAAAARLPYPS